MNLKDLRGSAAIVGVGHAGLGQANGYTEMEILVQAAHRAVADAGLTMQDIDGICTASVAATMWAMPVIEHLGIRPSFIDSTMLGGSSFVAHLLPAIHALSTGQCNAVLVCYGSTQRTSTLSRAEIGRVRKNFDPQPYETPYDPLSPLSSYALAAARHMHQYGTTREQLAEVALAASKWAQLNPEAQRRKPITLEEILAAPMVSDPLTVRDCCLVTDGAGAYVLVRADRARNLRQKPVYVLGNATAVWNRQISSMHDVTVTAAQESGRRAFEMAGVKPSDIDVLELYDAFTINPILFLEDLGFCAKGEGGAFVSGGRIAPGGELPMNTNGGGLCCVHPGMYGIFITIEAVRQLRGDTGERQVQGAQLALVHGNGGTLSSQSTAILGTADTL
ncbi:thiolase [Bordetella genomosp. 10]|uniref:Thiolase n=1 Tax=Bordetella genomosp. 10 TaxID=1416804 RepID=A0A261RYX2_9BORD|nr:thiolase [Bordetella genomosp. 10]OZI29957.1 thiolase [Bordetella genomosp. 10]